MICYKSWKGVDELEFREACSCGEYNRTLIVPYSILDKKYYVKAIW